MKAQERHIVKLFGSGLECIEYGIRLTARQESLAPVLEHGHFYPDDRIFSFINTPHRSFVVDLPDNDQAVLDSRRGKSLSLKGRL